MSVKSPTSPIPTWVGVLLAASSISHPLRLSSEAATSAASLGGPGRIASRGVREAQKFRSTIAPPALGPKTSQKARPSLQ